jgi:predicted Zn finger-like uncharacterized protein
MRIVCPSCSAAYDVSDTLLIGREAVRCARCAQEWQPVLTKPIAAPSVSPRPSAAPPLPKVGVPLRTPTVAPAPPVVRPARVQAASAIDRLMEAPAPPPRASVALRLAWIGSIALVLATIGAGYVWREQVMAAWQPSVRLYSALGLADAPR